MKFISPEVALYLYKSTIRPCMEYCCHVWAGAPSCYLELLDKLQKQIYRTVGPSLAISLEPLAHCRNIASLSLFYRYYFGRCSTELAQLVPLPYSRGKRTRYSDRLHDFSVTTPRDYKDAYVNSFQWFWKGSLHKNIQLMLEFLKASLCVLNFAYYTLMTFLMMLAVILESMLMILLFFYDVEVDFHF